MEQELTCPKCKGNKFSMIAKDTFKCAYCGNVFSLEKKNEEQQSSSHEPSQQIIYIQTHQQEKSSQAEEKENSNEDGLPIWVQIVAFVIALIVMYFFIYRH
jgi:uncharacterized Zn finger protein (UPF0148 family)